MSKYGTNGSGIFLSTPSARRATSFSMRLRLPTRNFYPRPPRGGRHDLRAGQGPRSEISIHALREEGDGSQPDALTVQTISIHALREEGDNFFAASSCRRSNFYPRPPRGGRPVSVVFSDRTPVISIHALREEGDLPQARFSVSVVISIHALREEGDPGMPRPLRTVCGISIHALREEGDILTCLIAFRISISIHALREEGDVPPQRGGRILVISIHALREEGDPEPPARSRPYYISIHALREEGDLTARRSPGLGTISIHALREEGDRRASFRVTQLLVFLSTPSARRATREVVTVVTA